MTEKLKNFGGKFEYLDYLIALYGEDATTGEVWKKEKEREKTCMKKGTPFLKSTIGQK